MKKLRLLLLLLVLVHVGSSAQEVIPPDSLETLLARTRHDTSRCALLLRMIEDEPDDRIWMEYNERLEAISLRNLNSTGLDSSLRRKYNGYLSNAFNNSAYFLDSHGQTYEAIELYRKALALCTSTNDKSAAGITCNNLAYAYRTIGQLDSAIHFYQQSISFLEDAADQSSAAQSRINLGNVFKDQGKIQLASEYYYSALKEYEQVKDIEGQAQVFANLGLLYQDQGDLDKALEFELKSLALCRQVDNKTGIGHTLLTLGYMYLQREDTVKGVGYSKLSLEQFRAINDQSGMAAALVNLAFICRLTGKLDEAERYSRQAMSIHQLLNEKDGLSQDYYNLCAIYVMQKDFPKAISFGRDALRLSQELGYPQNIRNSAQSLVSACKGAGMYPQAFDMLYLYTRMNDSINNRELRKNLIRRQLQYDYDRKALADSIRNVAERQLVTERLRKERAQRLALWGGLIMTLVFGGFIYNRFLVTRRQKIQISQEKQRSDELLLNILPEEVAEELKTKGSADARLFDDVTVMFTDFKNFTLISERLSPTELVNEIHTCFKAFDQIISKHNIEKIKTIGDAYMCAGGLPIANKTNAMDVVNAALEIQKFMAELSSERKAAGREVFEIRIGIHTGPVVAGIVGVKKFAYDIWGDTVNIAARMESSGEVGKVNISENTYALVRHRFKCIHRGMIEAKHKGQINMYFVEE